MRVLDSNDYYKFLGKCENSTQLEEQVQNESSKEYLKRVSIIWSSNISLPRKIHATKTFALPAIQYHMWTSDWSINSLKDIDRRTREIIRDEEGMHYHESIKLLYLPEELGGSGMMSAEDTYKTTTIKMANYLNNSEDKRIKQVRDLEFNKTSHDRRSIFKQAEKFAKEYDITCNFEDSATNITVSNTVTSTIETKIITDPAPKAIKDILKSKTVEKYLKEAEKQSWLGALNTLQLKDNDMAPRANQILKSWKNIPDVTYSVNRSIRQQLLPTRAYQKSKVQMKITDTRCRMCGTGVESTTHVMCACPKIAQSLYKARHDRMLRPIYHFLLKKYNFDENDHEKPWYLQKPPTAVVENDEAKIYWDVPFHLQKAPQNGANKIDMSLYDKRNNSWTLLEGTVCQVGTIADRTNKKQDKYTELRAGIKQLHKPKSIRQINIVFDFLGGYHTNMAKELNYITNSDKETTYLILRAQKWILCQNVNIVQKFYEYV